MSLLLAEPLSGVKAAMAQRAFNPGDFQTMSMLPQSVPDSFNVRILGPLEEVGSLLEGIEPERTTPEQVRNALREGAKRQRSLVWRRTHAINRDGRVIQARARLEMVMNRYFSDPAWSAKKLERELKQGQTPRRLAEKLLLNPSSYGTPVRVVQPPRPSDYVAALTELGQCLIEATEIAESRFPLIVREIRQREPAI